ncbi:MAG: hypothetical protein ACIALR_16260 [Blastopirellula sp. JB062]
MLRTFLIVLTLPLLFWLATGAVLPTANYSNAESTDLPGKADQWRHTVDGWEPLEAIQPESSATGQPPVHPLTLLPLVVAIALSALLAFEPADAKNADEGRDAGDA